MFVETWLPACINLEKSECFRDVYLFAWKVNENISIVIQPGITFKWTVL